MKLVIVHGNAHRGSTWHVADLLRRELSNLGALEVAEFALPRDMPHFCNGCFSCFFNGEHTCPHRDSVGPIAEAILWADVVVLTSSVYAMDVTGQLKALLDHLCYMWMSHRPDPRMFEKIGVVIVTTAGGGAGHAAKTMRRSLVFWGAKRVRVFKRVVSASKWSEVSEKRRAGIERDIHTLAKRVARLQASVGKLPAPLFRRFFFRIMAGMMRKNTWNPRDRNHWEAHGWLGEGR